MRLDDEESKGSGRNVRRLATTRIVRGLSLGKDAERQKSQFSSNSQPVSLENSSSSSIRDSSSENGSTNSLKLTVLNTKYNPAVAEVRINKKKDSAAVRNICMKNMMKIL